MSSAIVPGPRWRHRIRLAPIGFVLLAAGTGYALIQLDHQATAACADRKQQDAALRDVIHSAYEASAPSDAVLNAFPELKPFYTSGTPEFEEQQRSLAAQRDRVLDKLGDRPTC